MSGRNTKKYTPILLAVLVLAIALTAWMVLAGRVFIIKTVSVVGNGSVAAEDAIRYAQIPIGKSMYALDESAVAHAVDGSGRLAFVSLEKDYPDTVVLTVRERSRDILIENAGKVLVLDSEGYMVERLDAVPEESAVYVTGLSVQNYLPGAKIGADGRRLAAMTSVIQALQAAEADDLISELSVADTEQLYLYSRTGIKVMLGNTAELDVKVQLMKGALLDLEGRGETRGRLDVSSGNKADFRIE